MNRARAASKPAASRFEAMPRPRSSDGRSAPMQRTKESMRHLITIIGLLFYAACNPKSRFCDYTTPEHAVRSFVESGRVGDMAGARAAVVASERDRELHCDYRDIGDYSLRLAHTDGGSRAVVLLVVGPIQSPIACRREPDGWKVSLRDTIAGMQQQYAAMPR